MFQRFVIVFLVLFGSNLISSGQEIPPIQTYTPQDYNAENQNWSISQFSDNKIYIANNIGLLEYNGERWHLYPSPNESIMRSVKTVKDRIYAGYYMEFGFWENDSLGLLTYSSLSQKLKTPLIEDEQFWGIIALDDWIVFQSLNRLYIYNVENDTFKVIESDSIITKMYELNGSILFHRRDDGIYKIESGQDILITDDERIVGSTVINIFGIDDDLLLETQDDGFYLLKEGELNAWQSSYNPVLKNLSIYNSIRLKNGDFALGTISDGLIILNENGDLKYKIDQSNGLTNNTILALHEDVDNNIWLGLDNGVNCLNMESPYRVYNDKNGEVGAVYSSYIFNNILYLGTNQGLFYKTYKSNEDFRFIEGTQGQVWTLEEFDGSLFCGHNSGTFIIEGNQADKISNVQGTWNLKQIDGMPNMILQGNYDGLYVLTKVNGKWSLGHKIKGFDISSRFFEFLNETELLVSHEYRGVLKVSLNEDFTEAVAVNIKPISKGLKSSLLKYNNDIIYAYKEGIFKYNVPENRFIRDTLLTNLYNPESFISGKLIADSNTNRLWGFSNDGISFITPGKLSRIPELKTIPLSYDMRKSITSYENILSIDDKEYLLGTTFGYIMIDIENTSNKEYATKIDLITVKDFRRPDSLKVADKSSFGNFENHENVLEFSYSITEFDKFLKAEYQYQLEGMHDTWSQWSTSSTKVFENLPHGDYTFNVRARINNDITNNIASYSFRIDRPWFLSNLMITAYLIGLILLIILTHHTYKRYYRKQRLVLLEQKNKELEIQELANKQQAMRFRNENLQNDIDNKNRELAISTMSLIKKNEFLNNIKKELSEIDANRNVHRVIGIIDKNLNNTDDWNLFQEAFNNADKDFLKKIKSIHSSLTPNDLRLCAYLRLNLASKEIAPLLNISPRSVEVKRYRLRKKMNLPHKTSLADYIIGL